ncbi:ABC transporter ATP-binding protein [SAR202 cluster bacterium AD-804-J14_MRT_500m]|nr:ABC transporter ATP-binding protein [SAR202 cluster bacterium AD-804-J14_MRT_500m]
MNDEVGGLAVRVEGLTKGFGEFPVLRNLDVSVGWGRFLAIFGANGSGKTTFLKILSTQYSLDKGKIWMAGIPRNEDPVFIRKIIGVVAHQPMLYQDMTTLENLLFFSRMYRIPDSRKRVEEIIELFSIKSLMQRRVGTLSHGMQKRVAIARALLHIPPILLMDEPESGLDQESLGLVLKILQDYVQQGRTVLMTTHNVDIGLALANEVAVLSNGAFSYYGNREGIDADSFRSTHLSRIEVTR